MKDEAKIRELTRRFAEACNLPLPHPKAPAGELHDASGRLVFQWWKCAKHDTWMQPCWCAKIPHWHCSVDGCEVVKTAKFRSVTERELFRIARYLHEHG